MRRLRSWLRAFRPEVSDTVRGKTRRRLKALAAATNGARDAEVALRWIGAQTDLPSRATAGRHAIVAELERERDAALRQTRQALERDLPSLTRTLAKQLDYYWQKQRLDEPAPVRPMALAIADAIRDHSTALVSALQRIEPSRKADDVHKARIAAKRLRYLLEPLEDLVNVSDATARLQELQQRLGDIRDAHRLAQRVVRGIGEHAALDARRRALAAIDVRSTSEHERPRFASVRPGLVELARRAHAAEDTAFSAFSGQWDKREVASLEEVVEDIADAV